MNETLEAMWLFLPAAVANAAPVLANHVPVLRHWDTPVDLGKTYRGKRALGDNKTWRGIVCGVALAGVTGYLQTQIQPSEMPTFIHVMFAMSIGFGALYGDVVESFFKRQIDVAPGHSWFPFDQIDYILGGLLASIPYLLFGVEAVGVIIGGYFALHLITVFVAYHLGIRDRPI